MASFPNRARWLVLAAAIAAGRATAACTGMLNQVGATWCVACEPAYCVPMRHTMDVIVTPTPTPQVTSSNASTSITASVTSFGAFKDVDPANDVKNLKISASASGLSTFGLESIANVKGLVSLTLESLTLGPGTVADALPLTTLILTKCALPSSPLDFSRFASLTHLQITSCGLSVLPTLNVAALTKIATIDLQNNNLKQFPLQLLDLPISTVTIDLTGNPIEPFALTTAQLAKYNAMLIKVDATVKGPDAAVASGTPGLTSSAARDVVPSSPPSSSSVSSWQMALLAGVGGAGLAVIIAMVIIRQRNAKDDADSVLEDLDHPAYATTLDDNHLFLSHNTPMMVATDTLKPGDLISPLTEIGEDSTPFHTESDRCYRLLSPDELRLSRSGCPIPGGLSGSFDGERVMIRRLDHRDRPDVAKRFVQRVAALSLLKHENVVELLGASKLSGISLCAVFEHMEHGTLSSFLHVERSPLTLHQAQRMCLEIADGVAYLQATGFVLGTAFDVFRTDRILVNDHLTCKLNIVTCLDDLDSTSVQLSFGTGRLAFLAPEVASQLLTTETRRDDMDDEAAAVYALGVILGEVLSRQRPYAPLLHAVGPVAADGYVYDMYMTRKTPRVPPHALGDEVPPAWTQVIAECLSYAPRDRPTAADVCRRLRSSCEGGVAPH